MNILTLEHADRRQLEDRVLEILARYLDDVNEYRIFFFGSRTNGKSTEGSDIDIGILGEEKLPLKTLGEIQSEIDELPYLYKIQMIDFRRAEKFFRDVALQHTVPFSIQSHEKI